MPVSESDLVAALPHAEAAGSPEIVLANQASTLVDLGRGNEATEAAKRVLETQGLPGSVRSFVYHTLGRAGRFSPSFSNKLRIH